jgi:hypothetical protein
MKEKCERFVSFVNYKAFSEFSNLSINSKEELQQILTDSILKIPEGPSKSAFEYFFNQNRVNFLIDGVEDEKSLKLIDRIQNLTENSLWISTNSQLADKLEEKLKIKTFKFFPLTKDEREKFIEKFLETSKLDEEQRKEIQVKILRFIEKMNGKSISEEKSLSSPMMLKMIAESALKEEKGFDFQNIYQVYESFVEDLMEKESEGEKF